MREMRCVVLEDACPTCLNRAKRCPGGAVRVVNLPHSLAAAVTHRFGPNSFKLHRLPVPRAANDNQGLPGILRLRRPIGTLIVAAATPSAQLPCC